MTSAPHEPRLARVAAMIADPARSRMLAYLLSGEHASAGELAAAGSVRPSTASAHLARLVDGGFLVCEQRGRHRYFRLADAEIAHALQALALVAERGSHDRSWASPERARLREARCCYGHMAGRLGVALFDALRHDGRLREAPDGYALTVRGVQWLAGLGFAATQPGAPRASQPRFAYGCLDWSERRDHLAGSLGRDLLAHFFAQRWLRRPERGAAKAGGRVLTPTLAGCRELLPRIGIEASQRVG